MNEADSPLISGGVGGGQEARVFGGEVALFGGVGALFGGQLRAGVNSTEYGEWLAAVGAHGVGRRAAQEVAAQGRAEAMSEPGSRAMHSAERVDRAEY